MKFAPTSSGILTPIRGMEAKKPAAFNALPKVPHARDFMPGRPKHNHPKVADLNKDLANLSDPSKSTQRLFAVWTEPGERTAFCGLIGISIWAADGEDSAFCLGNCATIQTADGQMGEDRRKEILEWLSVTNCLSDENRENAGKTAMERYIDDHNQKILDNQVIQRREEARVLGEKMYTKNFPNTPMRGDSPRTVWKQKPLPDVVETETPAEAAETPEEAPVEAAEAVPGATEGVDTESDSKPESEAPKRRGRPKKSK